MRAYLDQLELLDEEREGRKKKEDEP